MKRKKGVKYFDVKNKKTLHSIPNPDCGGQTPKNKLGGAITFGDIEAVPDSRSPSARLAVLAPPTKHFLTLRGMLTLLP